MCERCPEPVCAQCGEDVTAYKRVAVTGDRTNRPIFLHPQCIDMFIMQRQEIDAKAREFERCFSMPAHKEII